MEMINSGAYNRNTHLAINLKNDNYHKIYKKNYAQKIHNNIYKFFIYSKTRESNKIFKFVFYSHKNHSIFPLYICFFVWQRVHLCSILCFLWILLKIYSANKFC